MNLNPYRELGLDDSAGWEEFLSRHEVAHQTIAAALQRRGKSVNRVPMDSDPRDNPDWMTDHAAIHTSINRQLGLLDTDIVSADLSDEAEYLDWMRTHCAMHEAENKALGITV